MTIGLNGLGLKKLIGSNELIMRKLTGSKIGGLNLK